MTIKNIKLASITEFGGYWKEHKITGGAVYVTTSICFEKVLEMVQVQPPNKLLHVQVSLSGPFGFRAH